MITGRPKLKINEVEFRKMYTDGIPILVIANHFKILQSSVRTFRIKLNIPPGKSSRIVKFDESEYRRLFEARVPYKKIAKQLGMSRNSVMVIRERLGLPNRNNCHQKVQHD